MFRVLASSLACISAIRASYSVHMKGLRNARVSRGCSYHLGSRSEYMNKPTFAGGRFGELAIELAEVISAVR